MGKRVLVLCLVGIMLSPGVGLASYPTVGVLQWYSGSSFFNGSGQFLTLVKATLTDANYYAAMAWVGATMAAADLAVIGRIAIKRGLIVGGVAGAAYLAYKGWEWANGDVVKPGPANWDNPYCTAPPGGWRDEGAPGGAAFTVCQSNSGCLPGLLHISVSNTVRGANNPGACVAPYFPNDGNWYCETGLSSYQPCPECELGSDYEIYKVCYPASEAVRDAWVNNGGTQVVTSGEIETGLSNDLTAGNSQAKAAALEAVGALAPPFNDWKNTGVPPVLPLTVGDANDMQGALDRSVPGSVGTDLAAQDTPEAKQAADQSAAEAGEQAAADKLAMAEAVRQGVDEAMDDGFDDMSTPSVSGPSEPEPGVKNPLNVILETFWAGMMSLPIVEALTGWQLELSGNSVLTLPLPSLFGGGSLTVDFAQYSAFLGWMGSMLLAIVGIKWTMYLFEG